MRVASFVLIFAVIIFMFTYSQNFTYHPLTPGGTVTSLSKTLLLTSAI